MSIEVMKQALDNEMEIADFIDKAPENWENDERAEWAKLQAMLHNIRMFKKAMRQFIAEAEKNNPVQVSPLDFVEMVIEKEHLVGKPIVWAQWPNKEKS